MGGASGAFTGTFIADGWIYPLEVLLALDLTLFMLLYTLSGALYIWAVLTYVSEFSMTFAAACCSLRLRSMVPVKR